MDPGHDAGSDDEGEEVYIECTETDEIIDVDPSNELDQATNDLDDVELEAEGATAGGETEEVERDDAILVFKNHTDSVFCVDVDSKTSTLVVSGGKDDRAFVWWLSTGEVLFECTGHTDSVTCAQFNCDSGLVATADMKGLVKVWSVESKQEAWSAEVDEIEWIDWHPKQSILAAGTQTGDVWVWEISTGACKTFSGHGCRCTAGKFMHDGSRICAGYEDGTVKAWDVSSGNCISKFMSGKSGHTAEVTCVGCHSSNMMAVTGSVDVTALLLNTTTGKALAKYACGESERESQDEKSEIDNNSVEAVGFSQSHKYVATATHFGELTIWDTSSHTQRHRCLHEAGVIRLQWDSADSVYTCCEDGSVYRWEVRGGNQLARWQGHLGHVLDLALTRDMAHIVTAGDDHTVRVFSVKSIEKQ